MMTEAEKIKLFKNRWNSYRYRRQIKGQPFFSFDEFYEQYKDEFYKDGKKDEKKVRKRNGGYESYTHSKLVKGVRYSTSRLPLDEYCKLRVTIEQDFYLNADKRVWDNVDINDLPMSFCHWLKRLDANNINTDKILGYKLSCPLMSYDDKSIKFYIDGFDLIKKNSKMQMRADYELFDKEIWPKLVQKYHLITLDEP